ncbi:MAG TPA: alanine racemase, partial [Clostridia bacterium]|nr:alanine racemase [Clostridia bacterium]
MSRFLKRTWAEVDLDAIAHNYKAIRSYIREGCKIMAVVKADAYGHGAPLAAQELQTLGADYFGVSNIEEAMQIRRSGITKPILILGFTPVNYARNLIDEQITQTVFSYEYGRELSNAAREAGGKIRAHIKMDTGMSRIGFVVEDEPAPDVIGRIEKTVALPGLEFEGVFTHFAVADEPENNFTQTQFERFTRALDALEAKGVT